MPPSAAPIEHYVQELRNTLSSNAPLIKVLALMEKNDTSYIFVVDDGFYRGVITIQGIAASMSELATCVTGIQQTNPSRNGR